MDYELCLSLARKRFIFLCEYVCDELFDPAVDGFDVGCFVFFWDFSFII